MRCAPPPTRVWSARACSPPRSKPVTVAAAVVHGSANSRVSELLPPRAAFDQRERRHDLRVRHAQAPQRERRAFHFDPLCEFDATSANVSSVTLSGPPLADCHRQDAAKRELSRRLGLGGRCSHGTVLGALTSPMAGDERPVRGVPDVGELRGHCVLPRQIHPGTLPSTISRQRWFQALWHVCAKPRTKPGRNAPMITLQLATVPLVGLPPQWTPPGAAVLTLEEIVAGSRLAGTPFGRMQMPPPGVSLMDAIRSPVGRFHMRVTLEVGSDRVAVDVGPIGDNEMLMLMGGLLVDQVRPHAPPRSLYAGSVVHNTSAVNTMGNCEVRCAHGEMIAGECCVECRSGNITVKFCC